jgi:hypothetical protein
MSHWVSPFDVCFYGYICLRNGTLAQKKAIRFLMDVRHNIHKKETFVSTSLLSHGFGLRGYAHSLPQRAFPWRDGNARCKVVSIWP